MSHPLPRLPREARRGLARGPKRRAGAPAGAAAMVAMDAVHQDGTWKIASIDTFG